jgi:replication factor A1/cellular nucleic acid-binding protein
MAQQLQQMPPMQSKLQLSKPCSPEVPTQGDINAIVGITQLLEGQNSVLNQIVYDIIKGRYGEPYQNSLADRLSQSLSASMVEQARLFNLLEEYVNQDQPQASDSILPPSRLPMDLRAEEEAIRGTKRVLPEIDVSEWEITCTKTCPRKGKRSCNTSKTTQRTAGTPSVRISRKTKKEKRRLRLIQEAQQPIPTPKDLPPRLCYNCRQPGHFANKCPNPQQQISKPGEFSPYLCHKCRQPGHYKRDCPNHQHQVQTLGAAKCVQDKHPSIQGEPDQINSMGNASIQNHSSPPLVISNLGTRFLLRGVDCDAPGF